jgi:formate-dependent nitrite reductase membrane component NrfD
MQNKYDTQIQDSWGWCIAVYLFLAGVGAGGYATGVLASFSGWDESIYRTGVTLGFPLLLIGTLFLIADLGVKTRALRVFLNPGTSWIARGSLIISVFMILSFIHLVGLWTGQIDAGVLAMIGGVNIVFSVLVMIYTGVLLGASRPIAFWNTAMLPLLFLLSASSTGIMATLLLSRPADTAGTHRLAQADVVLLVLETLVVIFYLQASHRTDESRASVQLILKGRLSNMFWFGLIVLGLALPLVLEIVDLTGGETNSALLRVAAASGLIGGLMLRRLILGAGVRVPLRAGGIEFTFPTPITPLR